MSAVASSLFRKAGLPRQADRVWLRERGSEKGVGVAVWGAVAGRWCHLGAVALGMSKSALASSKPEKENPGETVQLTSVQAPLLRAACQ